MNRCAPILALSHQFQSRTPIAGLTTVRRCLARKAAHLHRSGVRVCQRVAVMEKEREAVCSDSVLNIRPGLAMVPPIVHAATRTTCGHVHACQDAIDARASSVDGQRPVKGVECA